MSKNDTLVDSLETNFKITRDENLKMQSDIKQ